jgi:ethanolamine utilization protein EutN
MQYGIIQGTVTATQKVKELQGISLKVLQPCNDRGEPVGDAIVAVDSVSARPGDFVMWVGKREASLAIPGAPLANNYPVDAAVTGIIDDIG